MKDILEIKKRKKANKPKFLRQDTHKKKRLDKIWRKPRGCDSKKRLRMQNRVIVAPGYGTPDSMRGLTVTGLEILAKIIHPTNFKNLTIPEESCSRISASTGV